LAVHTAQGVEEFDRVVINADYSYAQESLLKRRLRRYRYSCSVYLLYLGLRGKTQGLAHHNLFFARDLRRNLSDIFVNRRTPLDPSFYIHVPTVTDPSLAPPGKDIAYVLVPVANLDRPRDRFEQFEERLREGVFDTVRARTGDDLRSLTEIEHRFYPGDFVSRYNIACGATFGLAHNLMQSAFFRPANRDTAMPGVYYVGASTQPGGGLPVVIASSKIVADMITKSNF
jgi:phytoene desaturase